MEIELKACFSMISLSAQFAVCSTHLAWSVEKDVNLINLHQSNLNGKNMVCIFYLFCYTVDMFFRIIFQLFN